VQAGCEGEEALTGLFMNLRVISSASGGRVAENTPTCTRAQLLSLAALLHSGYKPALTCSLGGSSWKIS
jgi:hypothetical protein